MSEEEKKADGIFKELGYEKKEVHDEITGTFLMYDKKIEKELTKRISFFKGRKIQCSESYLYVTKIIHKFVGNEYKNTIEAHKFADIYEDV